MELLLGKHLYNDNHRSSMTNSPSFSSASPSPARPTTSSSRLSPTRNQPLHALFLQAGISSPSLSSSYSSPPTTKSLKRPQIRPLSTTSNHNTDNNKPVQQIPNDEKKKVLKTNTGNSNNSGTKTITKTVTIPLSSFNSTMHNNSESQHLGPYEYDPSASQNSHQGWLGAGIEIPGLDSPPQVLTKANRSKNVPNDNQAQALANTTKVTTVSQSVPLLAVPPLPPARTNPPPIVTNESSSAAAITVAQSSTVEANGSIRQPIYYDKSDTGSVISEASLAPSLSRLRAAAESKLGVSKNSNSAILSSSSSSSQPPAITYPSVIPRSRSSSVQRGQDKNSGVWNSSTEVPHGPGVIGSAANKDRQRELSAVHIRPMNVLQISPTRVVRATMLEYSKAEGNSTDNTNGKINPIPLSALPLPPSISRPGLRLGTLVDPKYIPRFAVPTSKDTKRDTNGSTGNTGNNSRNTSPLPAAVGRSSSTVEINPAYNNNGSSNHDNNFYIPPVIFTSTSSPSKNPPSSSTLSSSVTPSRSTFTSPEDYFFALCTPKQKAILKWIRSLNIEIVPERRFTYSTVIEKEFDNEAQLQKEKEAFLSKNTPPSVLLNEVNTIMMNGNSAPLILPFFPKRLPHLLWDGVLLHELVCACEARSGRKVPTMHVRIPASTGPDVMNWNTNASVAPTSVMNGKSSVSSKLPSSAMSVGMMSQKSSNPTGLHASGNNNHHITVLAGTKIPRDGTLSLGAANKNMELVFELLRQRPKVNHRYLWATDELLLGTHDEIAWGLLDDLMKAYGGVTRTITPTKSKKDEKSELMQQGSAMQGGGSDEAPTNDVPSTSKVNFENIPKDRTNPSSVSLSQAQKLSKTQLRGIAEGTGATPLIPNAVSSSVPSPSSRMSTALPVSNASVALSVTDTVPLTTNDLGTESKSNTDQKMNSLEMLSHLGVDQIIYDGISAKYILPAGNWNYLKKNISSLLSLPNNPVNGTTKPKRYLPLIPNPLAVPPVLIPLLPATAAGMGISTRAFSQIHRQHTLKLQEEQTLSTVPIDPSRIGFGKILPVQIDEVHNWFRTLELGNIAPLNDASIYHVLDHELFNGSILAAIAIILEPELDPLGTHSGYKYYKKPKSFAEARANIEAALRMFRGSKWHLEPPPPLYIPYDRVHLHAPHPHHEHHQHHHHGKHAHIPPVPHDVLAGNAPTSNPYLGYGTEAHEPPQRLRSNSITSMVSQRTSRTHKSHRSHKTHHHPPGYSLVAAPTIPELYLYCTEEILVANRDAMYGLLWYICRFYGHIDAVQQAAHEMEELRLKVEQEHALAPPQEIPNINARSKNTPKTNSSSVKDDTPKPSLSTVLPETNGIPILLGTSTPRATSPLPTTVLQASGTGNNHESSSQLLSPGKKFNRSECEIMLWLSTLGIYDALGLDPNESDIVIKELEEECTHNNNLNSSFVSVGDSSTLPSNDNATNLSSPYRNNLANALLRRRYCTVKCTIGPLCDGTLLSDLLRILLPESNQKHKLLVTIEPNPHTPTIAKMNLQKCIDIIRQYLIGFSLRYITDDNIVEDLYQGQPKIVVGFLHDCMVYAQQNNIQGKFRFGLTAEIETLRAERLAAEAAAAAAAAAAKAAAAAAAKRRLSYTSTATSSRRERDPLSMLKLDDDSNDEKNQGQLSMNVNDYASMVVNQLSNPGKNDGNGNPLEGMGGILTGNPQQEEIDSKISGEILVQWLRSLDIILERPQDLELGNEGNQSASEWNNGILFCQLVNICETMKGLHRNPVLGLDKHPKTGAAKLANIRKALEILRLNPSMALEHLWSENAIRNGEAPIIRTILAQIRRAYGHHLFSHFHDLHPKAEEHIKSPLRVYLADKEGQWGIHNTHGGNK